MAVLVVLIVKEIVRFDEAAVTAIAVAAAVVVIDEEVQQSPKTQQHQMEHSKKVATYYG